MCARSATAKSRPPCVVSTRPSAANESSYLSNRKPCPKFARRPYAFGEAAGVGDRAARLTYDMRRRIDAITETGGRATTRPRVLAMEWLDPPYTAGHWVPEMIRLAGGHDEMGLEGTFSREITWDDVAQCDPEILIFMQ